MQVALSTMLVIAAMLLLATLNNLRAQPLGFVADGVLTMTVDADGTGLEDQRLADVHATDPAAIAGTAWRPAGDLRDQPAAGDQ